MLQFQGILAAFAMLQHHTPHQRMVRVAKKLMEKAGSEGKPWISGLYEYRVTPQSGSIASPLQLITQCTPREKDLPQLPSTLGTQEMYETHQELIRRQQNKPEKNYIELTPGMPVWVQHRRNTSWEPAAVMSQCNSNSYWIMQENGTDQPKVYRRTRTMLKIRCTNVRETRHSYSQLTEPEKAEFHTPAIPNETRNYVEHNSAENIFQDLVHPTKSDIEASASFDSKSEEREEIGEIVDEPAFTPAHTPAPALERVGEQSHTPGSRKSTRKNFILRILEFLRNGYPLCIWCLKVWT